MVDADGTQFTFGPAANPGALCHADAAAEPPPGVVRTGTGNVAVSTTPGGSGTHCAVKAHVFVWAIRITFGRFWSAEMTAWNRRRSRKQISATQTREACRRG